MEKKWWWIIAIIVVILLILILTRAIDIGLAPKRGLSLETEIAPSEETSEETCEDIIKEIIDEKVVPTQDDINKIQSICTNEELERITQELGGGAAGDVE